MDCVLQAQYTVHETLECGRGPEQPEWCSQLVQPICSGEGRFLLDSADKGICQYPSVKSRVEPVQELTFLNYRCGQKNWASLIP